MDNLKNQTKDMIIIDYYSERLFKYDTIPKRSQIG